MKAEAIGDNYEKSKLRSLMAKQSRRKPRGPISYQLASVQLISGVRNACRSSAKKKNEARRNKLYNYKGSGVLNISQQYRNAGEQRIGSSKACILATS